MSMVLGDLLHMVRQDYLDALEDAYEEALETGAPAELEPELGPLAWGDMRVAGKVMMVISEGEFNFKPAITFGWGDALPGQPEPLTVLVQPFTWDSMLIELTPADDTTITVEPMYQWLEQWASKPEGLDEEGPFKMVVHSLIQGISPQRWMVDMGSAPLEAWQDVLEAALAAGAVRLTIGAPQQA